MVIRFQMAENSTADHLLLDNIGIEIPADIEVERGGTVVPNNTIDLVGPRPVTVAFTLVYDLANVAPNGGNLLNLTSAVQVGNTLNCTASITAQPSTGQFAPGQADSFDIEITPTAAGTFLAEFVLTCDDPDESVYRVTIIGNGTAPEIDLQRPAGTSIASGGTDALGGVAENVLQSLTYYIVNGGNTNLDLTGSPAVDLQAQTNCTAAVVQQPALTSLPPAGLAPFVVELTPGSGAFSFTLTIVNNDPDEGTYTVTVSGTGLATPEIDVLDPSLASVVQGGVFSVGTIAPNSTQTYMFTIQNNGNMDLLLTGSPVIDILNANNVTAVVSLQPASTTIGVGASETFTLQVTPTANGSFSLQVQILNNDANEGAFTYTVAGFAGAVGGGGGGGGGGDDSGGGCVAGTTDTGLWSVLLGALALLAVVLRLRAVRD
jgi:hypothetical protein